MNISLTSLPASITSATGPSTPGYAGGGFAEAIGTAISQVEAAQASAKTSAAALLTGGQGDIHNVALAAQRASLSLELFQQVRNKFVSAYQEIMRMPI
jgi:flagellar hook-basal body complex protein FliE